MDLSPAKKAVLIVNENDIEGLNVYVEYGPCTIPTDSSYGIRLEFFIRVSYKGRKERGTFHGYDEIGLESDEFMDDIKSKVNGDIRSLREEYRTEFRKPKRGDIISGVLYLDLDEIAGFLGRNRKKVVPIKGVSGG